MGQPYAYLFHFVFISCASPAWAFKASAPEAFFDRGLKTFQRGAFDEAATSWADAARAYESQGKPAGQTAVLIYLSEAQSGQGQYQQAAQSLRLADKLADLPRIASALASLGNLVIATGPPETAEAYMRRGLELARQLGDTPLAAACPSPKLRPVSKWLICLL